MCTTQYLGFAKDNEPNIEFADTLSHYDKNDCSHPSHEGDLPPLMSSDGYAFSAVLSKSFAAEDIIGKTVVIHLSADDFTAHPSGNSGKKIACGEIRATARQVLTR